jgi:hypothetical protein
MLARYWLLESSRTVEHDEPIGLLNIRIQREVL